MKELDSLVKLEDKLKKKYRRLIYEKGDENKISILRNKIENIDKRIRYIRKSYFESTSSVETWSYTILGNKKTNQFWIDYNLIIFDHLTPEEQHNAVYKHHFPKEKRLNIINNICYDKLLEFAHRQKSRFAYQVLGIVLMESGAKISEELKKLILENSQWGDEKHKLKHQKDIDERKKYLYEFREKIKSYKDGTKTLVTNEPIYEIYEKKMKNKDYKVSLNRDSIF